jgi:hypothetical protein
MLAAEGQVHKLRGVINTPIDYFWTIGDTEYAPNTWLGKKIHLRFLNKITCLYCGRITKKSFNQGYCYPCFQRLARCDFCILKPEKCHYHQNTCREPEWGFSHCMQTHILYLANTSGLKVGITRANHIPTRWIDQGAIQAIPFFSVHTRYESGLIENKMRDFISDRTQWQRMLNADVPLIDLQKERERLHPLILEQIIPLNPSYRYLAEAKPIELQYPLLSLPNKLKSVSIDKTPELEGHLVGIKGQYFLFDTGQVINIRALGGYHLAVSVG